PEPRGGRSLAAPTASAILASQAARPSRGPAASQTPPPAATAERALPKSRPARQRARSGVFPLRSIAQRLLPAIAPVQSRQPPPAATPGQGARLAHTA